MDDSIVPMGIDATEVTVMSIIVTAVIASIVPVVDFVTIDVVMIADVDDPALAGKRRRGTTAQDCQTGNKRSDCHDLTPDERRLQIP